MCLIHTSRQREHTQFQIIYIYIIHILCIYNIYLLVCYVHILWLYMIICYSDKLLNKTTAQGNVLINRNTQKISTLAWGEHILHDGVLAHELRSRCLDVTWLQFLCALQTSQGSASQRVWGNLLLQAGHYQCLRLSNSTCSSETLGERSVRMVRSTVQQLGFPVIKAWLDQRFSGSLSSPINMVQSTHARIIRLIGNIFETEASSNLSDCFSLFFNEFVFHQTSLS